MVEDYRNIQFPPRAYPMSFLREELTRCRVRPCANVATIRDGLPVDVACVILVWQKPGSAVGELLITIEGKNGVSRGVLWPDRFEAQCRTVMSALMVSAYKQVR